MIFASPAYGSISAKHLSKTSKWGIKNVARWEYAPEACECGGERAEQKKFDPKSKLLTFRSPNNVKKC